MQSYVTYNKITGEIVSIMNSTSDDVLEKSPSLDIYFCSDCDKEWSKEGIEKNNLIFDTVDGEEFSYSVENLNKKPPYECPKCTKVLEAQRNIEMIKVTEKQMKRINKSHASFIKQPDGKIIFVEPTKKIKTYVPGIILVGDAN